MASKRSRPQPRSFRLAGLDGGVYAEVMRAEVGRGAPG